MKELIIRVDEDQVKITFDVRPTLSLHEVFGMLHVAQLHFDRMLNEDHKKARAGEKRRRK